ncbi:hypothetical protein BWQ96_03162 [Gracilariopsis chorda]|uniref:Protein TIC110, chloroplastic n=1 Tax=Gracilariopsis chorda TaxID=448386 RepID=A0A2V3IYD9_9FLOR|nr:hypothetical protein BWQ96_03162 [Gracilariopsis chorda]|eukprot:PXF47085.1 hypothetical protein BWQ96_03162 [Gracilariopsis chorda]
MLFGVAFLQGASLPLSRPQPVLKPSFARRRCLRFQVSRRAKFSASASENSSYARDAVKKEVGSAPDTVFGSLSAPLRAVLAAVAIGGSASVGFTTAPQKGILRPVAAVSGAVLATAGIASLRKGPEKAARKYLASLVADLGLDNSELAERVAETQSKFGVGDEVFEYMKQTLYQYFVLGMLRTSSVTFGEISQLTRLKHVLGLDGAVVGDAHYEASRAFYRTNVIHLEDEEDAVARQNAQWKLNKLLFLSDRMYADKDTEEAYRYERSRLLKFFSLSMDEYNERLEKVSLPFYKDVVARACVDTSVTQEDVLAAQAALGVREVQAERIRVDAYADRVEALVSEKGRLDEVDSQSLSRLRTLLKIEDDRATSTLKTLAEPVFRVEVGNALDAIKKGDESVASIYGRLALRQSELSFPGEAANEVISKVLNERAVELARVASKYLRVQNINGCISELNELLKYVDGVIRLMQISNDDLRDDASVIEKFLPSVSKGLSRTEPLQMYRIFLSKCLEDRQVTEEEEKQISRLRSVLGLSVKSAVDAFKLAAGPVYRKAVSSALDEKSYGDDKKAEITNIRQDLALPEETAKSIDVDLYRNILHKKVDGNRILQEQEAQELFVIRNFLNLSEEDTAPVHKSYMGPVYEQSVTEAMGPTGIMLDEYKNGLERLRDRLGLSKEDADAAFNKVVKQRMLVYVNRAISQLEKRSQFRGQSEERDVGDDPNIKRAGAVLGIDAGGLPIELSNLVDFYVRNGLVKEQEIEAEGEKRNVATYPVTLRGDLQPKVYNELYKQYVIQCFSAQTRNEKQRLFSALDQLGSILGMTEEEIGKIHSEIGTVIYKNYVNQALLRGPIEEKDFDFLSNIQRMLSMKPDHCQGLLRDAKENRVSVLLEKIFAQPKVLPESVKKMRTTAAALEVDLVKDLKVSAEQRGKLFGVEIDAAIDTGALSPDNQSLVAELQTSLQLDDETTKNILLECIQRRTLSHLVQAAASLRQNRSETAVAELKTMLRYGKLLPAKVNAPAVSVTEKQELYLLFQADVITGGAIKESAREQINLLKTMFGFSDADLEVRV